MEILLRNGEKINIEWTPLVYEYLEEYDGGLSKLVNDLEQKNHYYLVMNYIIFCMLQASLHQPIKYREAISLVNPKDYPKIIEFILLNENLVGKQDNSKESKIKNIHRY